MVFSSILRSLRGSNLEVFKFGMYLSFPIGWMYYFGTNLDERFSIPDFWPTQEQSHKIPFEKGDIKMEIDRINAKIKRRKLAEEQEEKERTAARVAAGKGEGEGVGSVSAAVAQARGLRDDEGSTR